MKFTHNNGGEARRRRRRRPTPLWTPLAYPAVAPPQQPNRQCCGTEFAQKKKINTASLARATKREVLKKKRTEREQHAERHKHTQTR